MRSYPVILEEIPAALRERIVLVDEADPVICQTGEDTRRELVDMIHEVANRVPLLAKRVRDLTARDLFGHISDDECEMIQQYEDHPRVMILDPEGDSIVFKPADEA
jgi:hypothetical protein